MLLQRLQNIKRHLIRMRHQRSFTQRKRRTLRSGAKAELLVWLDFGSWFRNGGKANDLVIVLEWNSAENGGDVILERLYVDFICENTIPDPDTGKSPPDPNNAHDHYFVVQALLFLVQQTDLLYDHTKDRPKFAHVWWVCDNANVSSGFCWLLSWLQVNY